MDWLTSEVQVWHLLIVAAVFVGWWIAASVGGDLEKRIEKAESWLKKIDAPRTGPSYVSLDEWLAWRREYVGKILKSEYEVVNLDARLESVEDGIDHLYLPWWKRKLVELLERE